MSGIAVGGYGPSERAGWNAVLGYGSGGPPALCPCIQSVLNSGPGEITIFFSQTMEENAAYSDPENYDIEPLPGYAGKIDITSIATQPDRVVIDFTGPVGAYLVTISNIQSQAGVVMCDEPGCNEAGFLVSQPGVVPQTVIRIFNTALGPIGLRQTTNPAPTIEDLMQQRAISQGVTMQVDIVLTRLAGSGINRNDATIAFTRLG